MGWPTARACRSGEESQQPTCPQVRPGRKCTHSVPSRRHSSHPFGVCRYTCRIMLRWGSLTVDVGVLAVSLPLRISPCSLGDAGRTSSDQLVHCWDMAPGKPDGGCRPGRSPAGWGVRHAQIHPPQGHPDRCHRAGGRVGRTETLTLVRHRTQSAAETIARLSVTAVFAHLVALPLPGAQPILAPLTALPDVQVSLYQTLRSAVHRVAAVARLRPPRRSPPASSARARRASRCGRSPRP